MLKVKLEEDGIHLDKERWVVPQTSNEHVLTILMNDDIGYRRQYIGIIYNLKRTVDKALVMLDVHR